MGEALSRELATASRISRDHDPSFDGLGEIPGVGETRESVHVRGILSDLGCGRADTRRARCGGAAAARGTDNRDGEAVARVSGPNNWQRTRRLRGVRAPRDRRDRPG